MKNVFKTGLFYLIAFSMVLGNSIVSIDFSTAIAHAEGLEIKAEVLAEKITVEPYPDPNPVTAVWGLNNESVIVTWTEITDNRLDGYKVVMSETSPAPAYPADGYIEWETDSTVTFYIHNDTFVCDQNYYYSVTALYDGHNDPSEFIAGNAAELNFACEAPVECGNGVYEPANDEECDNGEGNRDNMNPIYNHDGPLDRTYCSTSCELYEVLGEYCGDDNMNGPEQCDGSESCTLECTLIEEECSVEDNLIVNYSFEEPIVTNASLWQKMSSVLGWVIEKASDNSATTLELHRGWSANVAANGLQYAELDGDHSTRISQDVATEEGAEYKLFWSFAPRHSITIEQNYLSVEVDGSQVGTNGPVAGSAPLAQDDWTNSNYIFIADSLNTEIALEDIGPSNSYGTFVDNVRLCKIAEPASDNIPVITLIGSPIINIDHNSVYTDEGSTANDVEDGNITPNIVIVNPVDTSVPGTYTVTYNVVDTDANNAVEVTRVVIVGAPYAPWCSALLGVMRDYYREGTSAYRVENNVIDIDNKNGVNLSDLGLLASMYYAGDDDTCYAQFENPTSSEREFYFQCEDKEVGWCGGLLQGIKDSNGASKGDAKYFHVFDLNNDGHINLIDLALVTTLYFGEDQSACYPYYVPPFLMCENEKPYCGDDEVNQDTEQCDGDTPQSCTTDDGYEGIQSCNMPSNDPKLQSVEVTYCVWNSCITEEYCGDGIQNGLEQCDAGPDGSSTCSTSCEVIETGCVTNCGGGGTAFNIKDLDSSISCSAFNISWRTTKNSDTILNLGTESGVYTENIDNDTNTKNHSLELTDLLADTTYYYQVRAISSSGLEKEATEKSFTTPPTEQCGEVLGEKIEDVPLICDFLRPSGSVGGDLDVDGVFQYPNGSLLRDACVPGMPVYLIKDQKKLHIVSWQNLHDHYFGQRIYNVISSVVNSYENWTGQVLGTKVYADGSLLRGSDMKVYRLEKGQKQHINTLEKLAKYAGQEIINISDEVLNRY